MKKQQISSDAAPAAIGPYSQAVKHSNLMFCSGQIPLDPRTGELVGVGIEEQTRQVMKNLKAVLQAGSMDFTNIVKATIYLVDLADFAIVNAVYGECFDETPPARSCVQVPALPKGALVEIECIAVD